MLYCGDTAAAPPGLSDSQTDSQSAIRPATAARAAISPLVPLHRPPGRALPGPAQPLPQHRPGLGLGVPDPGDPLDHHSDPGQRPHLRREPRWPSARPPAPPPPPPAARRSACGAARAARQQPARPGHARPRPGATAMQSAPALPARQPHQPAARRARTSPPPAADEPQAPRSHDASGPALRGSPASSRPLTGTLLACHQLSRPEQAATVAAVTHPISEGSF